MSFQIIPELPVTDVQRSITFYTKMFGLAVEAVAPEQGTPTWAELSRDGRSIMLQERSLMEDEIAVLAKRPAGSVVMVFRVERDEARRIHEEVNALGGSVVMPLRDTDYGTTEFGVADPDNYVVIVAGR